jgi:3-oxoacyl-[acyl-carrier-protein] synthase-3
VGIVLEGIGTYLPERIVTNEAWPKDVVERWQQNRTWSPERAERALASIDNEGARKVLRAMAEVADDPFQGSRERRYMPEGMTAVDMQVEAAQRAMADAGVSARDIDFVLGSSLVPDLLNAHDVCGVHERLGIPAECFTIATEAVCNSFQMQLRLAEGLLRTRCRCGLLVQCSAASRTTPMEQPFSVHFGDGATAVVVRDAGHDRGC